MGMLFAPNDLVGRETASAAEDWLMQLSAIAQFNPNTKVRTENGMAQGNWRDDFKFKLEDFIDRFVVLGAARFEVLDAISSELAGLRSDFEQDPDPAEDATPRDPEPSNDWPGAEAAEPSPK